MSSFKNQERQRRGKEKGKKRIEERISGGIDPLREF